MSIASVSGRLRAQRLSAMTPEEFERRKATQKRSKLNSGPVPLHVQYMRAWRAAGKPANWPNMSDWLNPVAE